MQVPARMGMALEESGWMQLAEQPTWTLTPPAPHALQTFHGVVYIIIVIPRPPDPPPVSMQDQSRRLSGSVWAFAEAESDTAANQASKSIPARAVGIHAASVPREGSTLHDHSCISNIICSLLLNLVSNYSSSDSSSSYSGNVSKKKVIQESE